MNAIHAPSKCRYWIIKANSQADAMVRNLNFCSTMGLLSHSENNSIIPEYSEKEEQWALKQGFQKRNYSLGYL